MGIDFRKRLFPSDGLLGTRGKYGIVRDRTGGRSGVVVKIPEIEIKQIIDNLAEVGKAITLQMARAVASVGIDILSLAQPRVPVDTGKLRESGKVSLMIGAGFKDIAWGKKDGTIMANVRGLNYYKPVKRLGITVQYHRESDDKKMDVALWCHEFLYPHDQRKEKEEGKKYARKEGTGPKYLELIFATKRDSYIKFIEDYMEIGFINDLAKGAKKVISGQKTKFKVDRVAFTIDNIRQNEYFFSAKGNKIRSTIL